MSTEKPAYGPRPWEEEAGPQGGKSHRGWKEALGAEAGNPAGQRTDGFPLRALGQDWIVSSVENRIKAQFETEIRRRAMDAITEAERWLGLDQADRMRSAYAGDRGAGHYNWDGKHCMSARAGLPGLKLLLYLCLRRCHRDVTQDDAEAMMDVEAFAALPEDTPPGEGPNPNACSLALRWALGNRSSPSQEKEGGRGTEKAPETMDD